MATALFGEVAELICIHFTLFYISPRTFLIRLHIKKIIPSNENDY